MAPILCTGNAQEFARATHSFDRSEGGACVLACGFTKFDIATVLGCCDFVRLPWYNAARAYPFIWTDTPSRLTVLFVVYLPGCFRGGYDIIDAPSCLCFS